MDRRVAAGAGRQLGDARRDRLGGAVFSRIQTFTPRSGLAGGQATPPMPADPRIGVPK